MTRRRTLIASGVLVVVVAAGIVALVAGGSGDDGPRRPTRVALAYARVWEATCVALRTDADDTTAAVREHLAGGASTARRRRVALRLVVPYLGRTERRLSRVAAAVPPPEWRSYHRAARGRLLAAAGRTTAARARVRSGDLAALTGLRFDDLARSGGAPESLRRLTPACATPGAI